MIRKVISVLFYVLGGFFIYMCCLLAFMNLPQVGAAKFYIIGGFSVPTVIFLFIGAAINRFQDWKSSIGITILSSVGFTLFGIITFICLLLSPELEEFFPNYNLSGFDGYLSGGTIMFLLACLGWLLVRKNNKEIAEPVVSPDG